MSKFRHLFAAHVTSGMRDGANALANARGWRGAVYSVPLQPVGGGEITHYGLLTRAADAFVIEMALASTEVPPEWANPEQIAEIAAGLQGADQAAIGAVMGAVTYKTIPVADHVGGAKELFDTLLTGHNLQQVRYDPV